MKFKSESVLRRSLSDQMRHEGFEVQPIESEETGHGIPDMYFSGNNKKGWMELKNDKSMDDVLDLAMMEIVHIDFRPGQLAWLNKFKNKGTDVYLVLNCAIGLFFFKNDEIKSEYEISELVQHAKLSKVKNINSMI